jgi:hypothetical protein
MKSHCIHTLNFCVSLEEKNNVLIPLKENMKNYILLPNLHVSLVLKGQHLYFEFTVPLYTTAANTPCLHVFIYN